MPWSGIAYAEPKCQFIQAFSKELLSKRNVPLTWYLDKFCLVSNSSSFRRLQKDLATRGTYKGRGSIVSAFHALFHLLLSPTLWSVNCYCTRFTEKGPEGYGSYSYLVVERGVNFCTVQLLNPLKPLLSSNPQIPLPFSEETQKFHIFQLLVCSFDFFKR